MNKRSNALSRFRLAGGGPFHYNPRMVTLDKAFCLTALCMVLAFSSAAAPALPPMSVEIGPDHPLLIFSVPPDASGVQQDYASYVIGVWQDLPERYQAHAVLRLDPGGIDVAAKLRNLRATLPSLQEAEIPVSIEVADGRAAGYFPVKDVESLIKDFSCIKGVHADGLEFDDYYSFSGGEEFGLPPNVAWLRALIGQAPRYGRFVAVSLDGVNWGRLMANRWCEPVYRAMREHAGYVIPIAGGRGTHTVQATSCAMGLWLEKSAAHWGIAPTSEWYVDAHFVQPGVFGVPQGPEAMPPRLYRAMLMNGAMTGAAVYLFERGEDLWFGRERRMWTGAIEPTLSALLDLRLIPRRSFVEEKVRVVYQLTKSTTPAEFQMNLRDIDPVYDEGLMFRGAYGVAEVGQISELVLNSGRHYWIPIISPHAPAAELERYTRVVQPGEMTSAEAWTTLLDQHYRPDGLGAAFITRVGRGAYVMHTNENLYEQQHFRLPALPAPVRDFEASRTESGVVLTWPFREGDLAYQVYKRVPPDETWRRVAQDLDERTWTDANAGSETALSYAVTALTNEEEAFEGTVNHGDYLALSIVESRIAEEVVLGPLLGYAQSSPIASEAGPSEQSWWPSFEGVPEERMESAKAIVERLESWDRAFQRQDLEAIVDLYATNYADPQGWGFQYVRRAYQWFFERYDACNMDRQIRRWRVSVDDPDELQVLLYSRFHGVATDGPNGRAANVEAHFPRGGDGESWITFSNSEGAWRIVKTAPALPNFADILSFSLSSDQLLRLGPDVYRQ